MHISSPRSLFLAALAAAAVTTAAATPVARPLKKFTLHGANCPQVPYAEGKTVQYAVNGTDQAGFPGRLELYIEQPGYANATFTLAGPKNHLKIVADPKLLVYTDYAPGYPQYKRRADLDQAVDHLLSCQDAYEGQPLRCTAKGFPSDQFKVNARWKYSIPISFDEAVNQDNIFYGIDLIASAA